jgi:Holliday junction resolvasome RuvABC endonuclease subunit
MNIVGLDLSLRSTGIADATGTRTFGYSVKKHSPWTDHARRLKKLGTVIDRATEGADLVVIEAPAFSQSGAAHSLGALFGVVQVLLFQRGRTAIFIEPQKLKKFAVDHGGAAKDAVLAAAIRDGSPAKNFDEADAWWLRRMGQYAYSPDRRALPLYRQAVLAAIRWPDVGEERRNSA